MVIGARRGMSRLGCLVTTVLVAAAGYVAVYAGEPYVRYLRYKDAMEQEARFAARMTDDQIRRRLQLTADSLGLPPGAQEIGIRRTERQITIWADYAEVVQLPLLSRDLHFQPRVERSF